MNRMLSKTLREFCDETASDSFAPGGGCVSAVSGTFAASLGLMVLKLTFGKKKYAAFETENKELEREMQRHREVLLDCIERDMEGCDAVLAAMNMPKETDAEKAARKSAMQKASKKANEAPLTVCKETAELLYKFESACDKINQNTLSDWACGAMQAYAALEGAAFNVEINCGGTGDAEYEAEVKQVLQELLEKGRRSMIAVRDRVHAVLTSSS